MIKDLQLRLAPEVAFNDEKRRSFIAQKLKLGKDDTWHELPKKRSIDARGKTVVIQYSTQVYINENTPSRLQYDFNYQQVKNEPEVIIVGCGPAGMFAALRCLELGLKPVLLERGKDVRTRRRDLAAINKEHIVNPDSNYCFGEGGAGTYSDGKLYTRSKKRGDVRRILEILVNHGATEDILVDAHPHVGTNKLPKVVQAIRETILEHGGEIHFNARVSEFLLLGKKMVGVRTANGDVFKADYTILATGHSARDIYYLLHQQQIKIEAKPFALGVRIEHPQSIIDQMQYHCEDRGEYLPAASYSVVQQTKLGKRQRGVFSFCMCPGGFIVPAATAQEEVVVNGMSPSKRDSRFANSGIVVAIELDDVKDFSNHGELRALKFQAAIEKRAWKAGGETQKAPAQRLVDFVDGVNSNSLNVCSYQPGLESVDLKEVLPYGLDKRLKNAFTQIGKRMKPYFTNEANLVGVESRSSAPVTIPRNPETLEHVSIEGLYPCGEGAGYAGGIVSAAMDGERVVNAIVNLKIK